MALKMKYYDLSKVSISEWLKIGLNKRQKKWLILVQKWRKKHGQKKKTLSDTQINMLDVLGKK